VVWEKVLRVCSLETHPTPLEFVATQDCFGESGTPAQLMEKYGLNKSSISKVKRFSKKSKLNFKIHAFLISRRLNNLEVPSSSVSSGEPSPSLSYSSADRIPSPS